MKKAFLVVLMLSSSLIFAQNNISGSVSDESGNPIPGATVVVEGCLLYTSPSPRDRIRSRMPSSA